MSNRFPSKQWINQHNRMLSVDSQQIPFGSRSCIFASLNFEIRRVCFNALQHFEAHLGTFVEYKGLRKNKWHCGRRESFNRWRWNFHPIMDCLCRNRKTAQFKAPRSANPFQSQWGTKRNGARDHEHPTSRWPPLSTQETQCERKLRPMILDWKSVSSLILRWAFHDIWRRKNCVVRTGRVGKNFPV